MIGDHKEVYFSQYCSRCAHLERDGGDDPCDECLNNPSNTDSHKPVNFEEK